MDKYLGDAMGGSYEQNAFLNFSQGADSCISDFDRMNLGASSESIDDLVQRNIREVLSRVECEDVGTSQQQPSVSASNISQSAQSTVVARPSSSSRTRPGSTTAGPSSRGPSARPSSAQRTRPTSSTASADQGGPSVLDVAGHSDATLRLHKARIKGLEDELAKSNKAVQERDQQLAEALKELKTLRAEKAGWAKSQKAFEGQVDRLSRQVADAENALSVRDQQLKDLSKDGGKAERERQKAEQDTRSRELRLQRALEEVEKYKQLLQEVKSQEREGKDVAKSEYNRVVAENKRLERQRAELVAAFKKQLKLIDVLKRQKVHLEAARALQFTEEEFLKVLDMGNV